jgi:hypothetical protein
MKHYKNREVPARIDKYIDKTTCDLCGAEIKVEGFYNIDEVEIEHRITVKHRTGYDCPSGGSGTEVSVDMCANCFETKLVPWLKEQGVDPEKKDWDW